MAIGKAAGKRREYGELPRVPNFYWFLWITLWGLSGLVLAGKLLACRGADFHQAWSFWLSL